jgi:DNA polymerase-3 subunit delta'
MTWNIIGHEWAVKLLRGHVQNNSLRQAYLFTGPRGIGKNKLAVNFIQAIFCQSGDEPAEPCLVCRTCKRIQDLQHPDLYPVVLEQDSTQIKVDQIRELVHNLSLSPYEAEHKVGLLINLEYANTHTQNALLKTLEEPPDPVILVLTASSDESVLDTITSRCEEIKLTTVPLETTARGLVKLYQLEEDQASFLAHISGGRPEQALQYYRDPKALTFRQQLLDDHLEILKANSVQRFAYAAKASEDPNRLDNLLSTWLSLWQDVLNQAGKSQAPLKNVDRQHDIDLLVRAIDLPTASKALGLLKRAYELLGRNANQKLTLEDLLLQLPRVMI